MKKILGFASLGLLALILTAVFVTPRVAKNYLVKNGKQLFGRQIEIDKLSFNYFNGKLSVYDFKMYEANQEDVFVTFDTLILNTIPYKYLSNTIALDQFYLDGLRVNISQKEESFNFDDLLAFYDSEDSIQDNSKSYKYLLNNLELKRASLNFYDGDVDHTTSLEDFSFYIPQINWNQKEQSEADIAFQIADGGSIEADFKVHPKTQDFGGMVRISGLQLKSYNKYITQYANINAISGVLGTSIHIRGNTKFPKEVQISSDVIVEDFEMMDAHNKKFLASKKITGEISDININKNAITFASLLLEQPYINFELDSISNNFTKIFYLDSDTSVSETTTDSTNNTEEIAYYINSLKLTDGAMDYSDNLTGTPFDYHFSKIEVLSKDISNTKDWIEFKSTMLLNNRGSLKAEIGINPKKSMTAQIDVVVEDFLLSDLDIYSNYYTGHSFLVGDMVYYSSTKLYNGNLDSNNRLLIKDVDVKNNKGGVYTLPLKLAIWVLKDRKGDIELEVPVTGNLNDPEVDTWALVWATLRKRIFNAADNPVRPLARFLKVKPEEIERIDFNYPDTLITDSQSKQLDLILKLEKEKEELDITMDFLADPAIINKIIAEQQGIIFEKDSVKYLETSNQMIVDSIKTIVSKEDYNPQSILLDSLANAYSEAVVRNASEYLKKAEPLNKIKVQKARVSNYNVIDAHPQIKVKYTVREDNMLIEDKIESE